MHVTVRLEERIATLRLDLRLKVIPRVQCFDVQLPENLQNARARPVALRFFWPGFFERRAQWENADDERRHAAFRQVVPQRPNNGVEQLPLDSPRAGAVADRSAHASPGSLRTTHRMNPIEQNGVPASP